ncbi:MAG: AraD1 family protein [Sphingomonas sp.]
MRVSLVQFEDGAGRGVAVLRDMEPPRRLAGIESVRALARAAMAAGTSLVAQVDAAGDAGEVDLDAVTLLPPIDHEDPAHLALTGTGLTHLGSAEGRDKMHRSMTETNQQTDSMRMFLMGVEGGKPAAGEAGAQPEWFYKGNGCSLVAPGATLRSPDFALDAGEEPEIAGIYMIGDDGVPARLGFAIGNEFSDHVTERGNYLWLAHSKLRVAALGPELLLGELPQDVRGTSRILRDGQLLWEKPFVTGEANMSHSLANLEHHHFKYDLFCQPGDIHVHFFGTATLSFSEGVKTQEGDVFEISAPPFRLPARNPIAIEKPRDVGVRVL